MKSIIFTDEVMDKVTNLTYAFGSNTNLSYISLPKSMKGLTTLNHTFSYGFA